MTTEKMTKKQMKKQEIVDRILKTALRDHFYWTIEEDPRMKSYYEGLVDGEFQILMELDLVDKFWDMRFDWAIMEEILL